MNIRAAFNHLFQVILGAFGSSIQVAGKTPLPISPSVYCVEVWLLLLNTSLEQQHLARVRVVYDGRLESVTAVTCGSKFTMMSMTFGVSSSVTLLFDFWDVHGPLGMVLSVLVVFLLTVFYEVLKMWRVWLESKSKLAQPLCPYTAATSSRSESISALESSPSESSLTPMQSPPMDPNSRNSWLLHGIQTALHMLQVTLGYMLMLCVMSYNTWIFLGVIAGSVLGYFISFPLLGRI